MKSINLSRIRLTHPRLIAFFSAASVMLLSLTFFCQIGQAQQAAQLSLADILIGLRSKKVTLDERNRLLSDAVRTRGITFSITPEIEVELAGTGASSDLVGAIKQKSLPVKAAAKTEPAAPAPPVQDFDFYRQRADTNAKKGAFDLALNDYNKAIEMNPKDAAVYLDRGRAYAGKKSFDLAILDYDKTIELSPKESMAYFGRGEIQEKRGDAQKAMGDFQKAVELDANNELAKSSLKRIQEEQAKAEQARIAQEKIEQAKLLAKQKEAEATLAAAAKPKANPAEPKAKTAEPKEKAESKPSKETETSPVGDSKTVDLGSMIGQAVKMVVPFYPPIAKQTNIVGQITVQLTINEKGEVIAAKAVSGPAMLRASSEEAARRTRFKQVMSNGEPVKASGYVVYNFTGK